MGDISGGDELADAAGGDGGPAKGAGGVGADGEAEFMAELGETVSTGFSLVTEAEVFALVDFDDVGGVTEDVRGELASGEMREGEIEGENEGSVNAGGGEETEFLFERSDESEIGLLAEDAGGVRVKGDGEGGYAERFSASDDLGDDPLMAAVDAVEVPDGGDGGAEAGRELGETAVDLHAIPPESFRRGRETQIPFGDDKKIREVMLRPPG